MSRRTGKKALLQPKAAVGESANTESKGILLDDCVQQKSSDLQHDQKLHDDYPKNQSVLALILLFHLLSHCQMYIISFCSNKLTICY